MHIKRTAFRRRILDAADDIQQPPTF